MAKDAKKGTKKRSGGTRASTLRVDDPPKGGAPTPPKKFKAPPRGKRGPKGIVPTLQQVRDAGDVARELSSPSYDEDFGKRAPNRDDFVAALKTAKAWSDEAAATEAWAQYVRVQTDAAWNEALTMNRGFTPEFRAALDYDPSIAKRYSQTADFVNVRKVSAAKGVATRRKKTKAPKAP